MKMPPPFAAGRDVVNVVVETPWGSRYKFNYDEETELFKLKRLLPAGLLFPLDFGFVPGTKGGDGDPLDVLLFMDEPAYPGLLAECRLIGLLEARHKKDGKDYVRNDRLLAVALQTEQYGSLKDIGDVPESLLSGINHFFTYYHSCAGNDYIPLGTKDGQEAWSLVRRSVI